MRIVTTSSLLILASMAGCGGCDSCIANKEAADDGAAATATATSTLTTSPRDAAPEASSDAGETEKTKDAASASVDSGLPYLVASILPRPSGAPMPIGPVQSCGVYDAPLCEKECPKGNCRQDCDGVSCVLDCKGGWCAQSCGANATCKLRCVGGHCAQACANPEGCTKECSGGNCT